MPRGAVRAPCRRRIRRKLRSKIFHGGCSARVSNAMNRRMQRRDKTSKIERTHGTAGRIDGFEYSARLRSRRKPPVRYPDEGIRKSKNDLGMNRPLDDAPPLARERPASSFYGSSARRVHLRPLHAKVGTSIMRTAMARQWRGEGVEAGKPDDFPCFQQQQQQPLISLSVGGCRALSDACRLSPDGFFSSRFSRKTACLRAGNERRAENSAGRARASASSAARLKRAPFVLRRGLFVPALPARRWLSDCRGLAMCSAKTQASVRGCDFSACDRTASIFKPLTPISHDRLPCRFTNSRETCVYIYIYVYKRERAFRAISVLFQDGR